MELPGPYNWLHRRGGRNSGPGPRFRIIAWHVGEVSFTPRGAEIAVTRPVTRIWIERLDRPSRVNYYDISSQRLRAQLAGYLTTQSWQNLVFSVRAHGYKPQKQLGLDVVPAQP